MPTFAGGREYFKDAKLFATLSNGQTADIPNTKFTGLLIVSNGTLQPRFRDENSNLMFSGSLITSGDAEIIPVGMLKNSNVKEILCFGISGTLSFYELF